MASSCGDMERHLLRKSVASIIIITVVIIAIFAIVIDIIFVLLIIIITLMGCLRALETARHLLRKSVAARRLTSSCLYTSPHSNRSSHIS